MKKLFSLIILLLISQNGLNGNLSPYSSNRYPFFKSALPSRTSLLSKSNIALKSQKKIQNEISFTIDNLNSLIHENKTDLYQLQESLERDCLTATTQSLHENTIPSNNDDEYQLLIRKWFVQLTERILNPSNLPIPPVYNLSKSSSNAYQKLLQTLNYDKISLICLQEMTRISHYDELLNGIPAVKLAVSIGNSLQHEILIEKAANLTKLTNSLHKDTLLSPRYLSELIRKSEIMSNISTRREYAEYIHQQISQISNTSLQSMPTTQRKLSEKFSRSLRSSYWSYKVNVEIGMYLIYQAIQTWMIPYNEEDNSTSTAVNKRSFSMRPAFTHKIIRKGPSSLGCIEWNPLIYQFFLHQPKPLVLEPWSLPMLVPPKPWLTHNNGGYLLHSTNCVRLRSGDIHLDRLQCQDKDGRLHRILSGLDVLGQTAWKINKSILSTVQELQLQESNASSSLLYNNNPLTLNGERIFDDLRTQQGKEEEEEEEEQQNQREKSTSEMRWEQNYKIEIAKLFSNLTFYLPHSLDFRGRAYPIAPYLSVVGDDLSRGLLSYGKGKKLTSRGWYWLRVHLANTAGYSKGRTYQERVDFTDQHLSDILDSANNPLSGRQWWRYCGTSTPWQCLAACIEIRNALRCENPEEYISYLPISQDGSCNGFQHYAALGRDREGAYAVNLIPTLELNHTLPPEQQRPQDIYLHVAHLVSSSVAKEAAQHQTIRSQSKTASSSSSPPPPLHISELLANQISSRSLYKRIVMTSVYGLTPFTARQHVRDYLLHDEQLLLPSNRIKEAEIYLTSKIFEILYSSLFSSAKAIQDWLTSVAMEIGRSVPPLLVNGSSISSFIYPQTFLTWTTPLGYEVTQPYLLSTSTKQQRTALQKVNINPSYMSIISQSPPSSSSSSHTSPNSSPIPVDIHKQSTSFPPNFIHSLDATHMFLTALSCYTTHNLTSFAAVHDSFYSHASDYDTLQHTLIQEFIQLYSQPILHNLRNEFIAKYGHYKVPVSPSSSPSSFFKIQKSNSKKRFQKIPTHHWRKTRPPHTSPPHTSSSVLWRDIIIPPVPQCGDLQIQEINGSQYFFN